MLAPPADGTEALCDVLQLLGTAAVMVDGRGDVVGLNAAARDCLGVGLHMRNRRLVTADPAANRALTHLIAQCAAGAAACTDGQVVVARRDAGPLLLRIVALGGASRFYPAHAIVMVLDPGRVILPTELQLRTALGVSCGEAQLAIRLAAGESLESAARFFGISYETARKRVKSTFEKTETRRQAELVALVIRIGTLAGAAGVASVRAAAPPRRPRRAERSPAIRSAPRLGRAARPGCAALRPAMS